MPIYRVESENLFQSPGFPAATVVTGGKLVFINGQVSRDKNGVLVGHGDHVLQARQAFFNLRLALTAAGVTGADVAQYRVTAVGAGPDLVGPIMRARLEVFPDSPIVAPSIFVGATMLGRAEYLIEIEAIAVAD